MLHNIKQPTSRALLTWYDRHRRQMPWRALPDAKANPYHVWLSEIMLQQTTVATVKPYFEKFITRWPAIEDLAQASEDDVLTQWAGLGYYSRARNLYKCAHLIVDQYGGVFPKDIKTLKLLPGIGDYTASAIRAIAHDKPATVVDGNVERVISRIFALETPLPQSKKQIQTYAEKLSPKTRSGDYAQAIMDLGATICTPKSPKCSLCPWGKKCLAYDKKNQTKYPIKQTKKPRPKRYTTAFVFIGNQNRVFLRRRADKGLLAGMMEVPSSNWIKNKKEDKGNLSFLDQKTHYTLLPENIRHVFTHFELNVRVVLLPKEALTDKNGVWVKKDDLGNHPLPTLMKKIINYAYQSSDDVSIQKNKTVVK